MDADVRCPFCSGIIEQDDDNNIVKIGDKAAGTINSASVGRGFEFRVCIRAICPQEVSRESH